MHSFPRLALALGAIVLSAGALAQAVTVAGVRYEPTSDVRGAKLQLNGAGIRYKAFIKVYTAGLYLTKKAGTPAEVSAAPGAKRIAITMLRDIDSGELGKLFTRAVEDNVPKNELSKLVPGLIRMSQIFSDCKKLSAGDSFFVDWVPGTGTVISISNPKCSQPHDAFRELEFYNAMLSIWLGNSPADWKLKEAMLGKEAS